MSWFCLRMGWLKVEIFNYLLVIDTSFKSMGYWNFNYFVNPFPNLGDLISYELYN